jgi:hypothetical protein
MKYTSLAPTRLRALLNLNPVKSAMTIRITNAVMVLILPISSGRSNSPAAVNRSTMR